MPRKRTARPHLLTTRVSGPTLHQLRMIARALDLTVSFVAQRCIRNSITTDSVRRFIKKPKDAVPNAPFLPRGPRLAWAEAKRLKDEGFLLKQIADSLNKQNFLTHEGRIWKEDSVCRLLQRKERSRKARRRRKASSRPRAASQARSERK